MSGREEVLAAVNKLSSSLKQMVQDGRANYERSLDINDFVRSHGADQLHGLLTVYPVRLYTECFKSLGVKTRASLEALSATYSHSSDMQESVKKLLLAEEGYKCFILELDEVMNDHEEKTALPVVGVGEHLHTAATFVDGITGDLVTLNSIVEKSQYTLFVLRKHYV